MNEESPPRPAPLPLVVAVLALLLAMALFLSLGATVQVLHVGLGLWLTELLIFFRMPWSILKLSGRDPARFTGFAFPGWRMALWGFGLGAANFFALVVPVNYLATSIAPEWMKQLFDSSQIFANANTFDLFLIVTGVGVAAPICEEIFFRGVVQRTLAERLKPSAAIWVTAILFSAFHVDPVGFLARVELGLLFGVLFRVTGSIWPAVMAHAANNLVSTTLFFAVGDQVREEADVEPMAVVAVSLFGIALMWPLVWLPRRDPSLLAAKEPAADLPDPFPSPLWRQLLPWLAGAMLAVSLLFAVDLRGVQLNLFDIRYRLAPLPEKATDEERAARERLDDLRRMARSGELPIDAYADERRLASGN